jgi:osmotically-inducible protein OsmY
MRFDHGMIAGALLACLGCENLAEEAPSRGAQALTPFDQSTNPTDIQITADIRQSLVADPQISWGGKNCQIITVGGVATLRGVVYDAAERRAIGTKAAVTSGVLRVENRLAVQAR